MLSVTRNVALKDLEAHLNAIMSCVLLSQSSRGRKECGSILTLLYFLKSFTV